jgi:hypothetical protein
MSNKDDTLTQSQMLRTPDSADIIAAQKNNSYVRACASIEIGKDYSPPNPKLKKQIPATKRAIYQDYFFLNNNCLIN